MQIYEELKARGLIAQVTDEEFDRRRADYVAPPPKVDSGWLVRYMRNVDAASKGAVMK